MKLYVLVQWGDNVVGVVSSRSLAEGLEYYDIEDNKHHGASGYCIEFTLDKVEE